MLLRLLVPLVLLGGLPWSPLAACAAEGASPSASSCELRDGDRVVLLGGTFVEREGQFGYLETALTAACADRRITFRNLGWSGDTVWAESRGVFDPPAVGYQRTLDLVKELQPTVIVFAYGQNESFAGPAGLESFLNQYRKLCADLAPTGARFMFVTPLPLYSPDPRLPSLREADQQRRLYGDAIVTLGSTLGCVVDLGGAIQREIETATPATLVENYEGMHLTPAGYRWVAEALLATTGLPTQPFDSPELIALRGKIVEKNTLFFHRWRPQNVTYLFLFRKHEQGNNAVDIPAFDKLTAAADDEIATLRTKLGR